MVYYVQLEASVGEIKVVLESDLTVSMREKLGFMHQPYSPYCNPPLPSYFLPLPPLSIPFIFSHCQRITNKCSGNC